MAEIVYSHFEASSAVKAKHTEILEQRADYVRRRNEIIQQIASEYDCFGPDGVYLRDLSFAGFSLVPGHEVPEGWRRDRRFRPAIVPHLRTDIGRKVSARLDVLKSYPSGWDFTRYLLPRCDFGINLGGNLKTVRPRMLGEVLVIEVPHFEGQPPLEPAGCTPMKSSRYHRLVAEQLEREEEAGDGPGQAEAGGAS